MIGLICLDTQLHFLYNMSLVGLLYASVTTPEMLVSFVSEKNTISYAGCMSQLFFFLLFVIAECYMLTAMAYDHYVATALCSTALTVMSPSVCSLLVAAVYTMGLIGLTVETGFVLSLPYCGRLHLRCRGDSLPSGWVNLVVTSLTVVVSCTFILSSSPRISTAEGRAKAFGTCNSHLTAVGIFYGSTAFMYLKPSTATSLAQESVASVFYTSAIPMLNPLIYSLRNKEVKAAVRKTLRRKLD
ncbi:Olfactory receptor 8A1 [Tupaia chinensis]|uniref:Olfactory receptor 8A1 n=1 Tax=Tupaia chinensis TaxID=246437 RepID=L9L422_TUPCH|nr:Olfactory receptor 8A1 [Tupaia chinensis]